MVEEISLYQNPEQSGNFSLLALIGKDWLSIQWQSFLVLSRWLNIDLVLMDLNSISVHKRAKTELGDYPAILASSFVNKPYILNT